METKKNLQSEETIINQFQIVEVNPEKDDISGVLGISEERLNILHKDMEKEFNRFKEALKAASIHPDPDSYPLPSKTEQMVNYTKSCQNANEVAFCVSNFTNMLAILKEKVNTIQMLADMLQSRRGM